MNNFVSPSDYKALIQMYGQEGADRFLRQNQLDVMPNEVSFNAMPDGGYGEDGVENNLSVMPTATDEENVGGPDETPTLAARPDLSTLSGIAKSQRRSISDLYDQITKNIEKRYRAPDLNDMLIAIGMGMMSQPGENERGGFTGSLQRGLRGIGTYAQSKRDYQTDMNKMLSQIEIQKAKDLAGLEEKYLSGAAAALKPKPDRWMALAPGARMINITEMENLPVLTNEQYEALRQDPRNKGMKFMSTDGVPMEIQ